MLDYVAKLKKPEVIFQDRLFLMLVGDRFEAIAGYVTTEKYRLVEKGYVGRIERTRYECTGKEPVFMLLGEKTPFIKRLYGFDRVNMDLANAGILTR